MRGADAWIDERFGEDARLLAHAARAGGAAAMGFWRRDPESWLKDHTSPVSVADMAADQAVREILAGTKPAYGWMSEESATSRAEPGRPTFVVDPIDGTRGFLKGLEDWCISLAVVSAGRPVAGVLYQPPTDELYLAVSKTGAYLNGARIAASRTTTSRGARVAAPMSFTKTLAQQRAGVVEMPRLASLALRLAKVASGVYDAALVRENANDWDLAAADLLVHEAGGLVTTTDGGALKYGVGDLRHPELVAANEALNANLQSLLNRRH